MFAKQLNAIVIFFCIYYFVLTVKSLYILDRFIKKHIMTNNLHVQAIPYMEIKNAFQEAQTVFSYNDNRTKHSFLVTPNKTNTIGELIALYNKYEDKYYHDAMIYFDQFKIERIGAIDMQVQKTGMNTFKIISCFVSYDGYVVVSTEHSYINHMKALALIKNPRICRDFNPYLDNICMKGG